MEKPVASILKLAMVPGEGPRCPCPRTPPRIWKINGFPAEVHAWTREQWEPLEDKPEDTQVFENGIRVALRMR